uniref:Uncharacterized protein n=1 Tax=Rhodopseudomonas palustris (strain DX-1) TaxID=652103 RepID=E6VL51_RHOPX
MQKIFKAIGKYVTLEFSIVRRKSVATITSTLQNTVKELEAHMVEQSKLAVEKDNIAARAMKERDDHASEREAARVVAANIKALLS